MSDDEKTPVDQALDLIVYAPVGLALFARDMLPELVRKGRQQVHGQVATARMMGEFAVAQGKVEAEKLVARSRPAPPPAPTPAATPAPAPAPASKAAPTKAKSKAKAAGKAKASKAKAKAAPASPAAGDLAIPDYESLSASQVVPRLAGLDPAELESVRQFEAAHRGRKTILNRVRQLQAAG